MNLRLLLQEPTPKNRENILTWSLIFSAISDGRNMYVYTHKLDPVSKILDPGPCSSPYSRSDFSAVFMLRASPKSTDTPLNSCQPTGLCYLIPWRLGDWLILVRSDFDSIDYDLMRDSIFRFRFDFDSIGKSARGSLGYSIRAP